MVDKKEAIDVAEWIRRANKLKNKYGSYMDFKRDCIEIIGVDYFTIVDDMSNDVGNIVTLISANHFEGGRKNDRIHHARDVPYYQVLDDGSLIRIDTKIIIDKLTCVLKKHVNKGMIMRDFLNDQPLETLVDLSDRLFNKNTGKKKKTKITKSPGCYNIKVGGKRGSPLSLMLRE